MSTGHDQSLGAVRGAVTARSRAPVWATLFESLIRGVTAAVVLVLVLIVGTILLKGAPHVSWEFLSQPPRNMNTEGGVFPALFGTAVVILFMILMALPLGVLGAVYLAEYSRGGILARISRAAVSNLAGVPSIVFGLFGLGFFVLFVGRNLDATVFDTPRDAQELTERRAALEARRPAFEQQVRGEMAAMRFDSAESADAYRTRRMAELTTPSTRRVFGQGAMFWAAATLAILVLPVIIVSTEEALRAVPAMHREAAYGLGATKWQMIRGVVLPQALPGILTGAILAVARGAGELAPVLFVGVAAFKPDLPLTEPVTLGPLSIPVVNPFDAFMHLNYHIFTLATQSPNPDATRGLQFATTLVLVTLTLVLNLAAIWLRQKYSSRNAR